jgi:hypothetical protein
MGRALPETNSGLPTCLVKSAQELSQNYLHHPLPVRPKLMPDELFSSWVLRIARSAGMKPQSFCQMMWPGRTFWNRSLDRSASPLLVSSLAMITGTSSSAVEESLLSSLEGVLFPRMVRNGNTRWVLPLAIYHRTHLRSGLSFCPLCMREGEPYFRKAWRLSLFTSCQLHQCELLDRCRHCKYPMQPHRVEMGNRSAYSTRPLYFCSNCDSDLRVVRLKPVNKSLALYEANFMYALKRPNAGALDSFSLLAHVLLLLTSQRPRMQPFRRTVANENRCPLIARWKRDENSTIYFDGMSVSDRRLFLGTACWLLEDWPGKFVDIARRSNLRNSDLTRDYENAPAWYLQAVHNVRSH